jgi:large subunit ribosomal protein L25
VLYEAIPVWERAYAVSETKRSVEGAAGTRGADKVTSPSPPCVNLPGYTSKFTIFSQKTSCIFEFVVLYYIPNKGNDQTGQFLNKTSCRRLLRNQIFGGKDKMNTLKAEKRSMDIKAKKLRREGYVVGNVFGKKIEGSIPVKFHALELEKFLKKAHKGSQIMLDVEGTQYDALIKDVAYNPVAGRIDEIDFQALVSTEKVHSVVEVILENHDKIVEGVLQESLEEIAYKALPADLVDEVRVDVGDMKIGDVIRVKDLPIYADKKITIMTDPDAVVVALNAAHNAAVPETETAETEEEPKKDE